MTLSIKIDQAGKPSVTPGRAREDLDTGTSVTLTAVGGPFSAYQWTVLFRPVDIRTNTRATAVLGAASSSVSTLSPIDVRGTYLIQLAVDSGSGLGATAADISRITFYAGISGDKLRGQPNSDPRLLPRRMPAAGERGEHNVFDPIDTPNGNLDGWAREFERWERVWQDIWEGKTWASGRLDLTSGGASLVRGYNIANATRTAAGVVLVEFSVALPDANYSVLGTAREVGGSVTVHSELAASFVLERGDLAGSLVDAPMNFRVELGA